MQQRRQRVRHHYRAKHESHRTAERLWREGRLEPALKEYERVAKEAKQTKELFSIKKAEHDQQKLREELASMDLGALKTRAKEAGVDEDKLKKADGAELAKLIVDKALGGGIRAAAFNSFARAAIHDKLGDYDKSADLHKFALQLNEKLHADKPYHPTIALSKASVALAEAQRGNGRDATKLATQASRLVDMAAGEEGSTTAECLRVLGATAHAQAAHAKDGKETRQFYHSSLEQYNRAIAIYEKIGGAREIEVDLAVTLNDAAKMLQEREDEGDEDTAWLLYERARHILEHVEPGHNHTATVLYNIAAHHEERKEFVVAERYYRRALQSRLIEDYSDTLPHVLRHYPPVGEHATDHIRGGFVAERLPPDVQREGHPRYSSRRQLPSREAQCKSWLCELHAGGKQMVLKSYSALSTEGAARLEALIDGGIVVNANQFVARPLAVSEDRRVAEFKHCPATLRDCLPPPPPERPADAVGDAAIVARLPEPRLKGLLLQLAMALNHIHEYETVHAQLTPDCCLLQETEGEEDEGGSHERLLLADFSLGPPVTDGTFLYAAPELSNAHSIWYNFEPRHAAPHDMYALGLILFEAAFGCLPERNLDSDEVVWEGYTFDSQSRPTAAEEIEAVEAKEAKWREVPLPLRALRRRQELAREEDKAGSSELVDAAEREALGTLITQLLDTNPGRRPVAAELLLSAYFGGAVSQLRTAISGHLYTDAVLEAHQYGEEMKRRQSQSDSSPKLEPPDERPGGFGTAERLSSIRRQYSRALESFAGSRAPLELPATHCLQAVSDLTPPSLDGSAVQFGVKPTRYRHAQVNGISHGSFEFWKRIVSLYVQAFPQRADVAEEARKQVEFLERQARSDDEPPDDQTMAIEYEKVVLDLPPLSLLEAGQLYEAHEKWDAALEHYSRNCRIYASAIEGTEHQSEAHIEYETQLLEARAAVNRLCSFQSDCLDRSAKPGARRVVEFDPDCEVMLPSEQEEALIVATLQRRAKQEGVPPEEIEYAVAAVQPKEALIELILAKEAVNYRGPASGLEPHLSSLRSTLWNTRSERWAEGKRDTMFRFEGGSWRRSAIAEDDGTVAALEKRAEGLEEEQRKLKRQVESLSEMLAISNIERDKMAEVLQTRQQAADTASHTAELLHKLTTLHGRIEQDASPPVLFSEDREEVGTNNLAVAAGQLRRGVTYYCENGVEALLTDGGVELSQTSYPLHALTARLPDPLASRADIGGAQDLDSGTMVSGSVGGALRWWAAGGASRAQQSRGMVDALQRLASAWLLHTVLRPARPRASATRSDVAWLRAAEERLLWEVLPGIARRVEEAQSRFGLLLDLKAGTLSLHDPQTRRDSAAATEEGALRAVLFEGLRGPLCWMACPCAPQPSHCPRVEPG